MSDETTVILVCLGVLAIPVIFVAWNIFQDQQRKRRLAELEEARLTAIEHKRSIWGKEICDKLVARTLSIDMTTEMVRLSWGAPTNVDEREITKKGNKERWVYGIPRRGANYVWFTDGKVTKIKT